MEFLSFLFFFYLFTVSFQASFLVFPPSFYLSGNSTMCWKCSPSISRLSCAFVSSSMFWATWKTWHPCLQTLLPLQSKRELGALFLEGESDDGVLQFQFRLSKSETALSFLTKQKRQTYFTVAYMTLFFLPPKWIQFHMGKISSSY